MLGCLHFLYSTKKDNILAHLFLVSLLFYGYDNSSIIKRMASYCYEKKRKEKKNKCVNCSRILEKKFRLIIKYFSLDLNAVQVTELTGLSRLSINKYSLAVRKRIAIYCHADSDLFLGAEILTSLALLAQGALLKVVRPSITHL